jgi:hypothetical protein
MNESSSKPRLCAEAANSAAIVDEDLQLWLSAATWKIHQAKMQSFSLDMKWKGVQ